MKFQIPNMHHSKVNGRTHTDRHTDKPKAICPSNFFKVGDFFKVGGIINLFSCKEDCKARLTRFVSVLSPGS